MEYCWISRCRDWALFRRDCESELGFGLIDTPFRFHQWPFCFAHYHALLCGRLVVRDMQLEGMKFKPGVHELRVIPA